MGALYFGTDGGQVTVLGEHVNLLQSDWDPKCRPLADGLMCMAAQADFDRSREIFYRVMSELTTGCAAVPSGVAIATIPRVNLDEINVVTHYADPLVDDGVITSLIKEINRDVSVSFNMSSAVLDPVKFAQIFGLPVRVVPKDRCCQPLTAVPARPHKKKRIRKKWLKKYGWKVIYGPEKAWIFKDPVRGDILCVGPDTYKALREASVDAENVAVDD